MIEASKIHGQLKGYVLEVKIVVLGCKLQNIIQEMKQMNTEIVYRSTSNKSNSEVEFNKTLYVIQSIINNRL